MKKLYNMKKMTEITIMMKTREQAMDPMSLTMMRWVVTLDVITTA